MEYVHACFLMSLTSAGKFCHFSYYQILSTLLPCQHVRSQQYPVYSKVTPHHVRISQWKSLSYHKTKVLTTVIISAHYFTFYISEINFPSTFPIPLFL